MKWYERYSEWSLRHRFGVDVAAALGLAALVLPAATLSNASDVRVSLLEGAAMIAPLPWRRTRPEISALAVFLAGFICLVTEKGVLISPDLALPVALYSVTVYGKRWAYTSALVASLVGTFIFGFFQGRDNSLNTGASFAVEFALLSTFAASVFLTVWAVAFTRRARRATLDALRDRAERLEIERDQQARIAAALERTRIAREMHDIVAHSLSVIIAQADGGRYGSAHEPEIAREALATVAETGRAALADMRRLLGVLRTEEGDGPSSAVLPQPGKSDIDALVEEARTSGLRISLVRTGTARHLPPGAGLTIYRVCQESLTNILKHAGPDPSVTVAISWRPDALIAEITDDGRGAAADSSRSPGFGLLGMTERAALFGGTVQAGPRPGGGFRVRFHMPLPDSGMMSSSVQ